MRPWALIALLLAASAFGGCFGGDERAQPTPPVTMTPEPTPTTPSPPPATTPSATPTATPEPTPTPPPALPPKVVANQTFDFSTEGDPSGQSPKTRTTDRVPEEYATILVNVTLMRASAAPTPLPVSGTLNAPTVRVIAPDGTEVVLVNEEGTTLSESVPAQTGTWTVRYEGAGTMRASVLMTALS